MWTWTMAEGHSSEARRQILHETPCRQRRRPDTGHRSGGVAPPAFQTPSFLLKQASTRRTIQTRATLALSHLRPLTELSMRRSFALLVTALAMPAIAVAQERDRDFTFRDRVPAGAWLRVHTMHGD